MNSFYENLLNGLDQKLTVTKIVVGHSWISCELSDGNLGICANLSNASINTDFSSLYGSSLFETASLVNSDNILYASVGLACINAFYNKSKNLINLSCISDNNVNCTDGICISNKTIGIIGHMKRTYDFLYSKAKNVYMFEKDPKYREDIPYEKEKELLPKCDIVIITGTSIINHTIVEILNYSKTSYNILLGPSVPLKPLPYINRNSGFIIKDKEGFNSWNNNSKGSPLCFCEPFLYKKS